MKIFDVNFDALESDLDYRLKRQNLIASNVANVNTPGYQAKDLQFDNALKSVYDRENGGGDGSLMLRTDEMHLDDEGARLGVEGEFETYVVQAPGIDENGVDMDREMARMAENQAMYSASTIAFKKKMGMLKYAAQGGR